MPFKKPKSKADIEMSEADSLILNLQQIESSIRKITELADNSNLYDEELSQNLLLNNFLHIILKPDDSWDLREIFSKEQAKIVIDSLTKISDFLANGEGLLDSANYLMIARVIEARNHIKSIFIGRLF